MAAEAPNSVDVTEYQFKLHDKIQVFEAGGVLKDDVNLLATASAFGLVFIGNPTKPEIKVIQLQKFIDAKETGEPVQGRVIPLQGIPHNIAVSCDGSLLAVNYSLNGTALVAVYDVPSFLSANISLKNVFQISADVNVQALQILWNPVIASMFALVLSNGSLSIYLMKDIAFEFYSIDQKEQAKCACWSPKGKQIVVGFPNGKLVQYKPDLKAARTIPCPPNVLNEPFNTIAIQWLSTYQFAVVLLQNGEDMTPSLYIVNAPKIGQPSYINYSDICYSSGGPRKTQIFLTYIQTWNILLMATSNSMEVGVLGTAESGETPLWKQYVTPDEARIELPLTSDKQETYPIGFAIETGSTHQLVIAERQIPVMPMIHILSTHGLFVSFNFLNFSANAPDLCSPPRPIADTSGISDFQPLVISANNLSSQASSIPSHQVPQTTNTEVSFAVPTGATSTPAQDKKTKQIFGDATNTGNVFENLVPQGTTVSFATTATKPTTGASGVFGGLIAGGNQTFGQNPSTPAFGGQVGGVSQPFGQKPDPAPFGGKPPFGNLPFGQTTVSVITDPSKVQSSAPTKEQPIIQDASKPGFGSQNQNKDINKPLYTVPPSFTAVQQKAVATKDTTAVDTISNSDNEALKELTKVLIQQFESELKDLSKRSKNIDVTIGNMDESKEVIKQLNELEELSNQAIESTESLAADIQSLRNSLNECFVMIAETKSKLNMFENPELPELATLANINQTNRRQIIKLKSFLATNEAQLQIVNQQIDAQWSNYQDMYRKSKTKMKIPSLEGVYQTLLKQKDIIARERIKINNIKQRLGVKGIKDQNAANKNDITIESLADSILSMSLSDQVKADRANLTEDKVKKLRSILQNRKITEIKPQRPERVGVKSDVVREMRIKMEKAATTRDGASTKPEKMEKQRIKQDTPQIIAKPTPTKPTAMQPTFSVIPQQKAQEKPLQTTDTPALSFNTIIKPTATSAALKESPFAGFSNQSGTFNFGGTALQKSASITSTITFGGNTLTKPTAQLPFGGTQTTSTPQIWFGAKDDKTIAKPIPSLTPFAQSNVENEPKPSANVIFQPKAVQPDKAAVSFAGISSSDDRKDTKGKDFINLEVGSSKSQPEAQLKSDSKPEEKTDEKTASPFAALSLNKATGFGTGFSFGANTNTGGNIFGGQAGIAKPMPSIFGATQTPVVSSSSTIVASTNVTAPFLGSSTGFTPLSVASSQSPSNSAIASTTPSSASSFSFVSKPTTESVAPTVVASAASTFSFVSKTEPALTSATLTTTTTIAPTDITSTASTTTTTASTGSPFSLNFGSNTSSSLASGFNFAAFAKNLSTTSTAASTTATVPTTTAADSADSLFGNLNICKPSSQGAIPSTPSQPFAGSVFSTTAFSSPTSTADPKSIFGGVTSTSANLFSTSSFTTTTETTTVSATPAISSPINLSNSTVPASSAFGASSSVETTVTTPPIFASANTIASSGTSVFGSTPAVATTASIFGTTTAPTSAFSAATPTAIGTTSSAFGSSASTFSFSSGNVFGSGLPKPDQSVFGSPPVTSAVTSSPFGGATAQTTSPFGGSPAAQPASGGNLFGSTEGFGIQSANTGGSLFGGASSTQQSNVFGGTTNAPSIFGGQNSTSQTSGGSLFGQSGFGGENTQTGGSIFGGGGGASPVQPGAFSSTPAFGQSFGGGQQQQQASSPFASNFGSVFGGGSAFGQTTTAFGQSSPGGSFAQGGQSVAQSGFGSPGFAKPAFGGPPAFGNTPAFGAAPTFGGTATFGSPKSPFSGFGGQSPTTFSPPTQKNNLFESLGASETGLSFSNLAQTSSNAANAKQQFGGSSFSTWR